MPVIRVCVDVPTFVSTCKTVCGFECVCVFTHTARVPESPAWFWLNLQKVFHRVSTRVNCRLIITSRMAYSKGDGNNLSISLFLTHTHRAVQTIAQILRQGLNATRSTGETNWHENPKSIDGEDNRS